MNKFLTLNACFLPLEPSLSSLYKSIGSVALSCNHSSKSCHPVWVQPLKSSTLSPCAHFHFHELIYNLQIIPLSPLADRFHLAITSDYVPVCGSVFAFDLALVVSKCVAE